MLTPVTPFFQETHLLPPLTLAYKFLDQCWMLPQSILWLIRSLIFTADCILISACQILRIKSCENLKPKSPLGEDAVLVGHRCCVLSKEDVVDPPPENSISSIQMAKARGVGACEIDILLTKDNICVVFHDLTTTRVLDKPDNDCSEFVQELTLDQLRRHVFTDRPSETVPTLDEFVAASKAADMRLLIEIKEKRRIHLINTILCASLRAHDFESNVMCLNFCPLQLFHLSIMSPNVCQCLLVGPGTLLEVGTVDYQLASRLSVALSYLFDPVLIRLWCWWARLNPSITATCLDNAIASDDRILKLQCSGLQVLAFDVACQTRVQKLKDMSVSVISDSLTSNEWDGTEPDHV